MNSHEREFDDRIHKSKLEITRKRQTEFNNRNISVFFSFRFFFLFFLLVFCVFVCNVQCAYYEASGRKSDFRFIY